MFSKNTKSRGAAVFLAVASLFAVFAMPALAQIEGLTEAPISVIIGRIIDWLLGIAAGLAVLSIIIGGIYYTTAAGDDEQMKKAKSIITWAVLGLAIVIISYGVVVTVNNIIVGTS